MGQSIMKNIIYISPVAFLLAACAGVGGGGSSGGSTTPINYVNFNSPGASQTLSANMLTAEGTEDFTANGGITNGSYGSPELATGSISASTDGSGNYNRLQIAGKNSSAIADQANSSASMLTGTNPSFGSYQQVELTSSDGKQHAKLVNADKFNYQTFGVWDNFTSSTPQNKSRNFGIFNTGTATPLSVLSSKTGTASFTGDAYGINLENFSINSTQSYNNIETTSTVALTANFSNRTGTINFTNSTASRGSVDLSATEAAVFDMSGKLGWDNSNSLFTGSLRRANGETGTLNGRFYGPNADEAGGVFKTSGSTGNYIGVFGAKKQ